MVDVFLQARRDGNATRRFFNRLLIVQVGEPRKTVTDELGSYAGAYRKLAPDSIHDISRHTNNRAELSHQPTRVRERGVRRFKSPRQAQRFLDVHSAVHGLCDLGRHLRSTHLAAAKDNLTIPVWRPIFPVSPQSQLSTGRGSLRPAQLADGRRCAATIRRSRYRAFSVFTLYKSAT